MADISINQVINGSFTPDDLDDPNLPGWGIKSDFYDLIDVVVNQEVNVSLDGNMNSVFLEVFDATNMQAAITAQAGFNIANVKFTPQDGINYVIKASSFNGNEFFDYTLTTASVAQAGLVAPTITLIGTVNIDEWFSEARISIDAVDGAVGYEFTTQTDPGAWWNDTGGGSRNFTTGGNPGSQITVRVRAYDANQRGPESQLVVNLAQHETTTTVGPEVLGIPNVVFIGTNNVDEWWSTATFSWDAVDGATGYEFSTDGQWWNYNWDSTTVQVGGQPGTDVTIFVRAYNGNVGPTSTPVTATLAPQTTTTTAAPTPPIAINKGDTLNGTLDANSDSNPTRNNTYKVDYYIADIQDNDQITVELNSGEFDTYLQLIDADNGQVIQFNDDNGSTASSLINFVAEPGINYIIRVTSYSSATGNFTLSVSGVEPLLITGLHIIDNNAGDGFVIRFNINNPDARDYLFRFRDHNLNLLEGTYLANLMGNDIWFDFWNSQGIPNGNIYVEVSTNAGTDWTRSESIFVWLHNTNTPLPELNIPTPPGTLLSAIDIWEIAQGNILSAADLRINPLLDLKRILELSLLSKTTETNSSYEITLRTRSSLNKVNKLSLYSLREMFEFESLSLSNPIPQYVYESKFRFRILEDIFSEVELIYYIAREDEILHEDSGIIEYITANSEFVFNTEALFRSGIYVDYETSDALPMSFENGMLIMEKRSMGTFWQSNVLLITAQDIKNIISLHINGSAPEGYKFIVVMAYGNTREEAAAATNQVVINDDNDIKALNLSGSVYIVMAILFTLNEVDIVL